MLDAPGVYKRAANVMGREGEQVTSLFILTDKFQPPW